MTPISSEERKARKEHGCSYCGGVIKKGEIYNNEFYNNAGSSYTWKSHKRCQFLAGHYNMFDYCDEGLTADDFSTQIQELFSDNFTVAEMARLLYWKVLREESK